jgi:hypothetical protein
MAFPDRFSEHMRRWVFIILLLVYPFQVALAMADKCCAITSAGVTHHLAQSASGASAGEPVFVADDDSSALADPHCAACTFGHILYLPAHRLSSSSPDIATGRSPRTAQVDRCRSLARGFVIPAS